jgi:hypothetical protein
VASIVAVSLEGLEGEGAGTGASYRRVEVGAIAAYEGVQLISAL